ncbi:MAG TPA: 2'-5' RNA ligase family protein [Candidatus Saccharimonadales bacterium]|nr:2'-5' RNA ligase family protein [Candidatus Saccharimonadales bacterium]
MEGGLTEAHRIYGQLWNKTAPLLKSGGMRIDPLLRNKTGDLRRGVTLVAWPDAAVQRKVEEFLREAAAICPNQYFYKPAELHLTVLAVIPGSEFWREQIHRLPAFQAVLDQVFENRRQFTVQFRGVTASPDAVMVQGFPTDDSLAQLRDKLRDEFRRCNLGENLDRRYKATTAHLTSMRFSNPQANWKKLLDFLQAHRETDFGQTYFQSLQLIWSDWYASIETMRVIQEYPLKD